MSSRSEVRIRAPAREITFAQAVREALAE